MRRPRLKQESIRSCSDDDTVPELLQDQPKFEKKGPTKKRVYDMAQLASVPTSKVVKGSKHEPKDPQLYTEIMPHPPRLFSQQSLKAVDESTSFTKGRNTQEGLNKTVGEISPSKRQRPLTTNKTVMTQANIQARQANKAEPSLSDLAAGKMSVKS